MNYTQFYVLWHDNDMLMSIQELNSFGETVQERVERASDEIKERLGSLEKRGRAESLKEIEVHLHTLEPASMTRQVCCSYVVDNDKYLICCHVEKNNQF